jgi:hypothetical protein
MNRTALPTSNGTKQKAVEATSGLRRQMTAQEVSELTRLSPRMIWQLSWPRGDLPCTRIGRRVIYDPDDVAAWLQRRKAETQVEANGG